MNLSLGTLQQRSMMQMDMMYGDAGEWLLCGRRIGGDWLACCICWGVYVTTMPHPCARPLASSDDGSPPTPPYPQKVWACRERCPLCSKQISSDAFWFGEGLADEDGSQDAKLPLQISRGAKTLKSPDPFVLGVRSSPSVTHLSFVLDLHQALSPGA